MSKRKKSKSLVEIKTPSGNINRLEPVPKFKTLVEIKNRSGN